MSGKDLPPRRKQIPCRGIRWIANCQRAPSREVALCDDVGSPHRASEATQRFFAVFRPRWRGTLAPSARASDKPIAIACFRLVTLFPDPPLLSVPCLRSCIARSTLAAAFLLYLAIGCLLASAQQR